MQRDSPVLDQHVLTTSEVTGGSGQLSRENPDLGKDQ